MALVAVVTGASAGVGRATVAELARRGARIGLIARGRERLEAAAREVEALGGEALVLPCDVADAAAVERAADAVLERFGPIDVWVNNAMVSVFSPVDWMRPEEYRRVMEVTFLGYVHGTMAALRRMKPRDRGVIVAVGSSLAYRGIPLQSAYCAAKHAIDGFLDSLRCELAHENSGVRVTAVHLPAVNTPQFDWTRSHLPRRIAPLGPIFQPEIAARQIVHAALHPRREYWVGWSVVKTILGSFLFPGLLDRYIGRIAWEGQMTDEPARDRPDNLFEPAPGDWGAHGRFDDRATRFSPVAWAARHRGLVAGGLAALAGAVVTATMGLRRASPRRTRVG